MKFRITILAFTVFTIAISGCKKTEIQEDNDEELITTMILKFTPTNGGASTSFTFDDPDGPGGLAPTLDSIRLTTNTFYNVELQLLNKTANPIQDITTELKAENKAHRFYYLPSANMMVGNLDEDDNGVSLGIKSTWVTGGSAGTGSIIVILRHYANNPPNKLQADNPSDPKSDTDIQVIFPVKIS